MTTLIIVHAASMHPSVIMPYTVCIHSAAGGGIALFSTLLSMYAQLELCMPALCCVTHAEQGFTIVNNNRLSASSTVPLRGADLCMLL
jgi:hypothetical protein